MTAAVESMLYVGEVPWHGLGHAFNEPPVSVEVALAASGMDFHVGLADLQTCPMEPVKDKEGVILTPEHPGYLAVPGRATYRTDTGAPLGVVGLRYKPLQNADAFQPFQPFLDAGEAHIETCGVLYAGRRVWILAKLNRDNAVVVPGDEIAKYLLLSHSHDGSLAVHYGLTAIRVVCANTEAMARNHNASSLFRLKHTAKVADRLDDISKIVNVADARFEATVEQYRDLAARGIRTADLEKYVKIVLGVDPDKAEEDISTRAKNQMGRLVELFETGKGNDLPGVKGTWWAAYNAASEYLSHERGRNQESRVNQLWFGAAANMNQLALDAAVEMATGSLQAVA
jgi:phage/plasmid-like protein (TIGR03299 family)